MFKLSKDEFISSKKQEKADELIDYLEEEFKIKYSNLIDNLVSVAGIESFQSLIDMAKIATSENQKIMMVILDYNYTHWNAAADLRDNINELGMSKETSIIPYISLSFPEEYDNPHGLDFQHIFIFFITKYKEFKVAEECISYYVDKYNLIGCFI